MQYILQFVAFCLSLFAQTRINRIMMINRQMATCLIAFCMTAGVSIASNRTIYSNVKDSTDDKTTAVKQKENNLNGTEKTAKDKEKELPYDQLIKRLVACKMDFSL